MTVAGWPTSGVRVCTEEIQNSDVVRTEVRGRYWILRVETRNVFLYNNIKVCMELMKAGISPDFHTVLNTPCSRLEL